MRDNKCQSQAHVVNDKNTTTCFDLYKHWKASIGCPQQTLSYLKT